MGKKKFIDPKSSIHYQVVHRSQRDPALADEAASRYVLKAVPPSYNLLKLNMPQPVLQKGKYDVDQVPEGDYPEFEEQSDEEFDGEFEDEDFDEEFTDEEGSEPEADEDGKNSVSNARSKDAAPRLKEGKPSSERLGAQEDPSLYGIFFNDQDKYDYMKHLKPIGEDPGAVFMEPKATQKKDKSGGIQFLDEQAAEAHSGQRKVTFNLPSEALPSTNEERVGMLNRADPSLLDVNADVREVLYALDDEEYVDNAADDGFFAALDADVVPEGFEEEVAEVEGEEDDGDQEDWYKEFKKYKKHTPHDSDEENEDESDTHNSRWDRRTAETSFSVMSSSTMFRNDKLTLLDDQFDRVLGEYSDDEIGELDADDPSVRGDNLVSKQRLESLFDDFLDATEVMGHKKRLVPRIDRIGVIDSVRNELKENAKEAIKMYEEGREYVNKEEAEMVVPEEKVYDTWDVETVLTTYSNIYNRPKLITEVGARAAKIRLKGRLGLPVVEGGAQKENTDTVPDEENEGGEDEEDIEVVNKGVPRPKTESKEEKKRRKQEIKEERRNRRVEKKATKAAFKEEGKRQSKVLRNVLQQEKSVHIE
ncbi:hypothetical protein SpCBS45565_g05862 [Spizellomyces sp. 'palustris']|nr:hypothetical protein SpCBS45565_g05862 [Spizellomyces sp. 'palustris']